MLIIFKTNVVEIPNGCDLNSKIFFLKKFQVGFFNIGARINLQRLYLNKLQENSRKKISLKNITV